MNSSWNASDDLPERLARALAGAPTESARARLVARRRFEPELSFGRHSGPATATARAAAVMILLYRREGRWHLPLTMRPATLSKHASQISLPGGTIEPGESSCDAAVRELAEELGVDGPVRPIGQLHDCYVFASNFVVTPWVAAVDAPPAWRLDLQEVERVVEMSLETLLDPRSIGTLTIERGPLVFRAPCYQVEGDCAWGTTCVILGELAEVLRSMNAPPF